MTPDGSGGGVGDSGGGGGAVPETQMLEGEPCGVRRKMGHSAWGTLRSGWDIQEAAGIVWLELREMGQ